VGASISIPLFSGGKDYYATKSASESRKAASLSRENVLRVGLAKLKAAYSTYLESVLKLEVDRTFADALIAREKIAREKYNNGLLTFEDWDIIENDLINRQKSLLQSERDRIVSEAAWEQALGKGVLP
jgi:outer membrane protein TolC